MAKKPRSSRPAKKPVPGGVPTSGGPSVRVRMYRQGLGDCFLITFDAGRDERHVLIDCGTLGTKSTDVTMAHVVGDIAKTTMRGGRSQLEVLVATHAHKDHVSGFLSQKAAFAKFGVANVWMGWTEDPSDALAKKLAKAANALRASVAEALRLAPANGALGQRLAGVLEFEGLEATAGGGLAMGDTIADALDFVRTFPGARTTYHSPGGPPVQVPTIPGFRFYVLGPPRSEEKLSSMGDDGSSELYGFNSAMRLRSETGGARGGDLPFDARYSHAIGEVDRLYGEYAREEYRRIDRQWMDAAAGAAASLDRFRNNTSLALAIERVADGQVLLFPADAQQGNWLSWHDLSWRVRDPGGALRTVTAADLLSRTVFYKVGHHSSHNATAKGKGLEIMRRGQNLTAFIPVDREVALGKSPAGSWRMPAVALYRELLEACDGRVVRGDLGWADDAARAARPDIEDELKGIATGAEWDHWRRSQAMAAGVKIQPHCVDFVLE